jgi:hypothetical protein
MSKMKTTEPSVDEAGKGMKSGGKTKKMAMGGAMPVGPLAAAAAQPMGSRAMPSRPAMGRPAMGRKPDPRAAMLEAAMAQRAGAGAAPMMRKKGGKAEGDAETKSEMKKDKAQDKAMISKAFKQHDMQEHKGDKGTSLKLKNGGMKGYATGGVVQKYATGGVVQKFADGGFAKMMCGGGTSHKAMKKGGSF